MSAGAIMFWSAVVGAVVALVKRNVTVKETDQPEYLLHAFWGFLLGGLFGMAVAALAQPVMVPL